MRVVTGGTGVKVAESVCTVLHNGVYSDVRLNTKIVKESEFLFFAVKIPGNFQLASSAPATCFSPWSVFPLP